MAKGPFAFVGLLLFMVAAASGQGNTDSLRNRLTIHNKGIGGHNTRNGKARFQRDVLDLKPDYVFIYFGLNDTLNEPQFVPLDEFIENLTWMTEKARSSGVKGGSL